ncbi:MAG: PASTA domain-containing protein [Coriobacteriia bacterium]|nr:PASTA domain-containing protein [Coriobacteriia bacterium]
MDDEIHEQETDSPVPAKEEVADVDGDGDGAVLGDGSADADVGADAAAGDVGAEPESGLEPEPEPETSDLDEDAFETTVLPTIVSDTEDVAEPSADETLVMPAVDAYAYSDADPAGGYAVAEAVPMIGGSDDAAAAMSAVSAAAPPDPAATPPVQEIEPLPEVDMGPEHRSNAFVWVGLLISVLIVGAAAGFSWWYLTQRPLTVPDVVGKLPVEAVQVLNDGGLRVGKVSEEPTEAAVPGTVIAQMPLAGSQLTPGKRVALVVAAPPEDVKVPDVTGRTEQEATAALARVSLYPVQISVFSPAVPLGNVASQVPAAGEDLDPGSPVALVISKGPASLQLRVPGLKGLAEVDAAKLLDACGLLSAPYRAVDASTTAGTVIAQSFNPDESIAYDHVVQYLVSEGASTVDTITVVDVVGKDRAVAEKAIKDLGLAVDVRLSSHPSVGKGAVISQMPMSGMQAAKGGTVGIVVSEGAETTVPMPALEGISSEEASKAVSGIGLVPVILEVGSRRNPNGTVIGQYPSADVQWGLRLPVVIIVAKS